jgi:hypothetical protein
MSAQKKQVFGGNIPSFRSPVPHPPLLIARIAVEIMANNALTRPAAAIKIMDTRGIFFSCLLTKIKYTIKIIAHNVKMVPAKLTLLKRKNWVRSVQLLIFPRINKENASTVKKKIVQNRLRNNKYTV